MLLVLPEIDEATRIIGAYSMAKLYPYVEAEALRGRVSRGELLEAINRLQPAYIYYAGHGLPSMWLTGSPGRLEPLLTARDAGVLGGRLVWTVSCYTARVLGRRAVGAGAKAYIGFTDRFIFVCRSCSPEDPLLEEFLGPPVTGALDAARGIGSLEAYERMRLEYSRYIDIELSRNPATAALLLHDMSVSTHLGRDTAVRVSARKPTPAPLVLTALAIIIARQLS